MNALTRIILFVIPLLVLAGLVALFALNIDRDPRRISSVLIDKPAPEFTLAAVPGITRNGSPLPGFSRADLDGDMTLVNIFASWCVPCREEHPILMEIARSGAIRIFGINQKDAPENARAFLNELGNPYAAIGGDNNGRVSIDWGVYGVPETFLVDEKGTIVFKHIGPLTEEAVTENLIPAIQKARAK